MHHLGRWEEITGESEERWHLSPLPIETFLLVSFALIILPTERQVLIAPFIFKAIILVFSNLPSFFLDFLLLIFIYLREEMSTGIAIFVCFSAEGYFHLK